MSLNLTIIRHFLFIAPVNCILNTNDKLDHKLVSDQEHHDHDSNSGLTFDDNESHSDEPSMVDDDGKSDPANGGDDDHQEITRVRIGYGYGF